MCWWTIACRHTRCHNIARVDVGLYESRSIWKDAAWRTCHFFSRTRQKLWTKGETSGHYLNVVDIYLDCDADTLLIKVHPIGPTCHRGTTACFDTPEDEGFVRSLAQLIHSRHEELPEGSYTTRLFIKGVKAIAKKVGEECTESIIEAVDGNRDRFIYEAGDLLYHYLVLMEQMGISVTDLEHELRLRHS